MKKKLFILCIWLLVLMPGVMAGDFNISNFSNPSQNWFFVQGSSGNVGIGTTEPGRRLQVTTADSTVASIGDAPGMKLLTRTTFGETGAEILFSGYYGQTYGTAAIGIINTENAAYEASDLYFATKIGTDAGDRPIERMRITKTGNVGIGTTGPDYSLEVAGTGASNLDLLTLTNSNTGGWGTTLNFKNDVYNGGYILGAVKSGATGTGGWLSLYTADTSEVLRERVYIGNDGNVGIGTTSPKAGLHVDNSEAFILENSGAAVANQRMFLFDVQDDGGGVGQLAISSRNDAGGFVALPMVLNHNGNVGIGTTSPQQELNVKGDANITGLCVAEDSLISVVDMEEFEGIDEGHQTYDPQNHAPNISATPQNQKNSWLFSDQTRGMENTGKITNNEEKNKKGSNGMEPNLLTPSCDNSNKAKYLNVSVDSIDNRAGMAEWSTQLVNTKYPSGCVGSIPTSSADENSNYKIKKVPIQDIKPGQYVLSLNETSGKLEPAEVKALLDMGEKPIYELITESGTAINTTGAHPYLVKNHEDSLDSCFEICLVEIPIPMSNKSDSYVHNEIFFDKQSATKSSSLVCLPSNSFASASDFLYLSNGTKVILSKIKEDKILSSSSDNLDLDNIPCLLLRNSCLSLNGANSDNLSWNIKSIISPCEINILNSTLASSTASIYINPSNLSCECIDDLTLFDSSSASFSVNLDLEMISLATESSNSLTNDCINLAKANSNLSLNSEGTSTLTLISAMSEDNNQGYLKLSEWLEVSKLKEGMEIAVVDGYEVKWEKIVSIKQHSPQHVYDLMIEGTHNFIANDIVAHNTYLGGNLDMENNGIVDIDWSSSDDGSGSGLDADKLDGSEKTAFQMDVADSCSGENVIQTISQAGVVGCYDTYSATDDAIGSIAEWQTLCADCVQTSDIGDILDSSHITDIYLFNNANDATTGTLTANSFELGDDDYIGIGSGSERIQFDSDGDDIEIMGGNVGIGTTGPGAKLDVNGIIKGNSLQIHTLASGRLASDLPNTYTARNIFFDDVYSGSETGWPNTYGSLITFMGRSGHEGLQIFQMPSYTADLRVRSTWYDQSSGWGGWRTMAFTDSPSFSGNIYFPGSGIWNSSGNVGIGTTAPGAPLEVYVDESGADATAGGIMLTRFHDADPDYRGGAIYSRFIDAASADALVFGVTGVNSKNPYSDFDQARMVILHSGNVGIGTTSPASKLSVGGVGHSNYAIYGIGTAVYGVGVYGASSGTSGRGVTGYASASTGITYGLRGESESTSGRGVLGFADASTGTTYGVYGLSDSTSGYDFYAGGAGTDYGPFTGGHEVKVSNNFPEGVKSGMIVSVTGETQIRYGKDNIDISSTLPTVELSSIQNDKRIFGVFTAEVNISKDHWYINSSKAYDRFATVNALGEGRVWATNINGDIEAGDYITSSRISGYGQKQDDDLLHSYTLGKAIETVDWDNVNEVVEFNSSTYKAHLIAVVYTSG